MTLYFSSISHAADATYATAMSTVDGMKELKDDYRMVFLDDRHWCSSDEILRNENKK